MRQKKTDDDIFAMLASLSEKCHCGRRTERLWGEGERERQKCHHHIRSSIRRGIKVSSGFGETRPSLILGPVLQRVSSKLHDIFSPLGDLAAAKGRR